LSEIYIPHYGEMNGFVFRVANQLYGRLILEKEEVSFEEIK